MGREVFNRILYPVHSYLIDNILIDSGPMTAEKHFLPLIEKEKDSIDYIINTHCHEDHIGNNLTIQKMTGAQIYIHPLGLDTLTYPKSLGLYPYQKFFWGTPPPSSGNSIPNTVTGNRFIFQILHTPGHSEDHICIYEPDNGIIFTGDLYWGQKIISFRPIDDFYAIKHSLEKINQLDIDAIYCGFRGRVEHGNKAITRKLNYMETLEKTVKAHAFQGYDVKSIVKRTLGRENYMKWLTNGQFSKENVILSILSQD
ncbi:MAG: MBL fold metallo-hydrolase [Candidatus Lokiarchaeota archaeon]|nr:MBL fold metallo-hydrolase [Candidatus Lokiarchaeota archaeon]